MTQWCQPADGTQGERVETGRTGAVIAKESNERPRGKKLFTRPQRSLRPRTSDLIYHNPFFFTLRLPFNAKKKQDLSKYEAVIGIECHVQLSTQSKAFCSCSNEAGRKDSPLSSADDETSGGGSSSSSALRPNSSVCPICLGHPGTLPTLNAAAVAKGIAAGLALNCRLSPRLKFDRKQYFYPDLPTGYQISQHDEPLCFGGRIEVPVPPGERSSSSSSSAGTEGGEDRKKKKGGGGGGKKGGGGGGGGGDSTPAASLDTFSVSIERAHLEEDAGKLVHSGSAQLSGASHSLVDYNRAGVPLLEVVSGPDMRSGAQAAAYGAELRRLMVYLGVSRAAMQDGGMRCDVNVSVRERGQAALGTKVEVKNMNSFSAMARAVDWEVERQAALLEAGRGAEIVQETRLFDEATGQTAPMRSKGGAADYRYVAEPDLPPGELPEGLVERVRSELPELPAAFRRRLSGEGGGTGLPAADVLVLSDEASTARFFSAALDALPPSSSSSSSSSSPNHAPDPAPVKLLSNWTVGDVMAHCKEVKRPMDALEHLRPEALAEMVALIADGTLSGKLGKELLPLLLAGEANDEGGTGSFSRGGVRSLVERKGMAQISDQASIDALVDSVLDANAAQLAEFRAGKTKLQGFFVGELMKASQGRANPALLNATLARKLKGE